MPMENVVSSDFQLRLDLSLVAACAQERDTIGYEFLKKISFKPKNILPGDEYEFMISKDGNDPQIFSGEVKFDDINIKTKKVETFDWGGRGVTIGRKLKVGQLSELADKAIKDIATKQLNKPVEFLMDLLYYANATSMTLGPDTFDLTTFEGTSAELIETTHSIWDLTCVNETTISVGTTAAATLAEVRTAVDKMINGVRGFTDTSGEGYPFAKLRYGDFVFASDTYMEPRLSDLKMQQASPERGYQNYTGIDYFTHPTLREASHDRLYAFQKSTGFKAILWLACQDSPEVKVIFNDRNKSWEIIPTFDWGIWPLDPRGVIMGRKA